MLAKKLCHWPDFPAKANLHQGGTLFYFGKLIKWVLKLTMITSAHVTQQQQ